MMLQIFENLGITYGRKGYRLIGRVTFCNHYVGLGWPVHRGIKSIKNSFLFLLNIVPSSVVAGQKGA
jgi:hypothetical protein